MKELIKTYMIGERPEISNSEKMFLELKDLFTEEKELFIVFHLDSKNNVISREIVSIGTINKCVLSPSTIFRNSIKLNANSILLAHNHPSGDLNPSYEDKKVTNELKKAGEILQIEVLDHIIFNNEKYKSINEEQKRDTI